MKQNGGRRRKKQTPEQTDLMIGRFRLGDLNKLFADRYGGDRATYEFADDDAGREDLVILLQHYGHTNPHKMPQIIEVRAPWMDEDEAVRTIDRVNAYPRKWRAPTLAQELHLTSVDRRRLKIRTIRAFDMTPEKYKQERNLANRKRKRLVRRKQPRAKWLATNNKSRTKPWEAAGMSRRTWYRQQAKLNGTGVSPSNTSTKQVAQVGGTGVSAVKVTAAPNGTGVSAVLLPSAADIPVPLSKSPEPEEAGHVCAALSARARPLSMSKLRVPKDAPAVLMQTPAADGEPDFPWICVAIGNC